MDNLDVSFEEEAYSFIKTLSKEEKSVNKSVSIATGTASYPFISKIVKTLKKKCKAYLCYFPNKYCLFISPIFYHFYLFCFCPFLYKLSIDFIRQKW